MRRALRVLAWVLLGSIALVALVLGGSYAFVRSNWGRDKIIAFTLNRLGPMFPGGLTVEKIDGDLLSGLVFHGVMVRDLEKRPAIAADRLEVRYKLWPLVGKRLRIAYLGGQGVLVVSRTLGDGRNSLATMVKLAPSTKPKPEGPTDLPLTFSLDDADLDAHFVHLPKSTMAVEDAPSDLDWQGRVQAKATLSAKKHLDVDLLRVEVLHPNVAVVTAKGELDFRGPLTFEKTDIRVEADAKEARRRVEALPFVGPLVVTASGGGTLDDLDAKVTASIASQGVKLQSGVHLGKSHVALDGLVLDAPATEVRGDGRIQFNGGFAAKVHAKSSDLAKLRGLGAPPLTGSAGIDGDIEWNHGRMQIKALAETRALNVSGLHIGHAKVDVDTVDFLGSAKVFIEDLQQGGITINAATLDAHASKTGMRLQLDASGPRKSVMKLRIAGRPIVEGERYVGADATIESLEARFGQIGWTTEHPTRIRGKIIGPEIWIEQLVLIEGEKQRITLGGKLAGKTLDRVHIDVQHFDFGRLTPLLAPGRLLPKTDLSAEIRAEGDLEDPLVTAHLAGQAYGRGEKDAIHVVGEASATLQHHRANGKVFVTIGGQKANAHFDLPLPLRPNAKLEATADVSVLFSPAFSELLVPKLIQFQPVAMHSLSGLVTAQLRVSGTTSQPQINFAAKVARGGLGRAFGELGFSAEYKDRLASAEAKVTLSSLPAGGGSGGGIIEASAKLPIDLPAVLTGRGGNVLLPQAALNGTVKLQHVGMDYLPFDAFRLKLPVKHGVFDGTVAVAGTLHRPKITAQLKAEKLEAQGINQIGLALHATVDGRAISSDGTVAIKGSELVRFRAAINGERHNDFRKAALDGRLVIEGFDLATLAAMVNVSGKLHGEIKIAGAVDDPQGNAKLDITDLAIGEVKFDSFVATAKLDSALQATLLATQPGGAKLDGALRWPLGGDGEVSGKLVAQRFLLDLHGDTLPGIRLLRGQLDSKLAFDGTRQKPRLRGELTIQRGELRVPATAMTYREIDTRIVIDEKAVKLEKLSVKSGQNGVARATGIMNLDHFKPTGVDATLSAQRFPISQSGISVLLDTDLKVEGKRDKDGALTGRIRVQKGAARLPELQSTRLLHPTGALEDVKFVGEEKESKGIGLSLAATLEGPFQVKGKEIDAKVRGRIAVDLTGPEPVLRGQLRVERGGWLELFSRRYDIDRGNISFDGSDDPLLSFRISRRLRDLSIGADVTGRAKKPSITFWSDPAKLDSTQVVGLILSGDPGTSAVTTTGLQKQALGAVSSLVVNSIKQNLLPELPIDVVRFDTNQTSGSNAAGSRIEVGKYLTQSLYIGYAHQVGVDRVGTRRTNRNEARVDYRLPKNWQIEGTFGDAGVGGVDLYWTYRPAPPR